MEIDKRKLEQLILEATREVQRERSEAVREDKTADNSAYMDPLQTKSSPLIKGCKPCSQRYMEQRIEKDF